MQKYDCIVVGCGFAGAVAARELAEKKEKKVLILDARDHVGGNCYDLPDEYGIRIHQYGPHISIQTAKGSMSTFPVLPSGFLLDMKWWEMYMEKNCRFHLT